jgi:hypothetical protein
MPGTDPERPKDIAVRARQIYAALSRDDLQSLRRSQMVDPEASMDPEAFIAQLLTRGHLLSYLSRTSWSPVTP